MVVVVDWPCPTGTRLLDLSVRSPFNSSLGPDVQRTGGVAAQRAEDDKRRRYGGLSILPCVFETGGRPGDSAQALVRMLVRMAAGEDEVPATAALLWQRISHGLQAAASWQLATAVVRRGLLATAAM